MKNKIKTFFINIKREGQYNTLESPQIYVIDRKNEQQGNVEILDKEDSTLNGLLLKNEPPLKVFSYAFKENSFRHERYNKKGDLMAFAKCNKYRQCECILFPSDFKENNWILLVELKYALDYTAASRKNNAYPQNMIEQVIQTSEYIRRHKIIPANKMINAVLSFPNIINNFNSTLFEGDIFIEDESKIDLRKSPTNNIMNRTQIAVKYKILISAQNEATIKSEQKLIFT